MKLNKKYMTITALLSATAMASAFAASTTQNTTVATNKVSHRRGSHTQMQNVDQKAQMAQALAEALGTTSEAITAQLNAGKKPHDIIKASGLDEATVRAQLEASHEADVKAKLQSDIASGKITQEEADAMVVGQKNHKSKGEDGMSNKEKMLANTATILGTTKESLRAQIASGETIHQIIAAVGISETDFRTKIKALRHTI